MEPLWPYYAFFMSWIQCSVVVWLSVTMESQSTDVYSISDNSSTSSTEPTTSAVVTFSSVVMPTCPPPNSIHLLCDVTLSKRYITCKERAEVVQLCYNTFKDIYYNDTDLSKCENSCDEVVSLLKNLGVLPILTTTTTATRTTVLTPTTPSIASSNTSIASTTSSNNSSANTTTALQSVTSTASSNTSSQTSLTTDNLSNTSSNSSVSSSTLSLISVTFSKVDISTTISPPINTSREVPMSMAGETIDTEEMPPLSYLFAIFGAALILIEVMVLCYIFCYRKKKYGSPVGRYRRTSTGSMVITEEVMEAETTSPTQALCNGPGGGGPLSDEAVCQEDQHIFRSYINLRYIDDTSNEGTPERVPVK